MARRSVGSSERVIQPCSSNASATSVAERGVIRSDEASAEGRTGSAEAITRRARDCAGVIPHASSSRAVSRRSRNFTRSLQRMQGTGVAPDR